MSEEIQFKQLLEELQNFQKNLKKDSEERRNSIKVLEYKVSEVNKIRLNFDILRQNFNKDLHDVSLIDKIRLIVSEFETYLKSVYAILSDRATTLNFELLSETGAGFKLSSPELQQETNMTEKFDLKTAAGLIPIMDGTEHTTKQIIDSIHWYDSLLDNAGKNLLTSYVLKTRLSESAKIRLNQNYTSNQLLIEDLKSHFISKKSISTLSVQLNNAKQKSHGLDAFGKSLEELLVDLTITQAGHNEQNLNILRPINEKIAINSFANGLNNHELRTIIKSRNYSTLKDAIAGAKDEELSLNSSRQVFQMGVNGNNRVFTRGHRHMSYNNRGQFRHGNRGFNTPNFRQNFSGNRPPFINNYNKNNYPHQNSNNFNRQNRRNFSRGNYNNSRGTGRGYFMQQSQDTVTKNANETFFRDPQ